SRHFLLFFFTSPPPAETYTLSLHDALPISALMRLSTAVAFRAMPPHPQMPMMPIRFRSTSGLSPRKSTAALKSSVLMSGDAMLRSEEHTSELQSRSDLVCRLLLEKKKKSKE